MIPHLLSRAVETAQLVLFFTSSYWVFVTNFMNPAVLTILKPYDLPSVLPDVADLSLPEWIL
jgi:hypothetical protein